MIHRKQNTMIDLRAYGYTETKEPDQGLQPGRVTEHRGSQFIIIPKKER